MCLSIEINTRQSRAQKEVLHVEIINGAQRIVGLDDFFILLILGCSKLTNKTRNKWVFDIFRK